jgi:chromosome partitioning protein
MMTTIIASMGRKGGITKTTTIVNLGAALALEGKRVLVIETDGQGNASESMGIAPYDGFKQLIIDEADWQDVIVQVPSLFTGKPTELYLVSAADQTRLVEELKDTPSRMVERCAELRGFFDYVLFDTSPGLTQIHTGCYYAADYLLLPTLCETDSINSLAKTFEFLDQARAAAPGLHVADVMGIIPNRYMKGERTGAFALGRLEERYGEYGRKCHVFPQLRDLMAWGEARRVQKSIYAISGNIFDPKFRKNAGDARREFGRVVEAALAVAS